MKYIKCCENGKIETLARLTSDKQAVEIIYETKTGGNIVDRETISYNQLAIYHMIYISLSSTD